MRMSAGRLNRRVTIERAEIAYSDLNEPIKTWVLLACNVPAAREDVSDSELIASGALGASLGSRVTVRPDAVFEASHPASRLSLAVARGHIHAVRDERCNLP